jgi:hypothetical protein
MLLQLLINVNRSCGLQRKGMDCYVLADSCWKMLLMVVGQLLGTATKVLESQCEMPKAYWKASGQYLKGIGKPLGNAQMPNVRQ